MPRIESLGMLASDDGALYLSEEYGKVFDNIQRECIANILKNKDLSGDPTAGSCEAKRFVNAKSQKYGTARAAGKGNKVKAKPITISIDTDQELIEEVEDKDVRLGGVDNLVERRTANHKLSMERDFENDFLTCGFADSEVFVTSCDTVKSKVDAIINKIADTENEFVDGIPEEFIHVVLCSDYYTAMQEYMDEKAQTGDAKKSSFGDYHGVTIHKSHRLPGSAKMMGMVIGSIAQPGYPNISKPSQIGLSEAYGFGIFYHYGTKSVAPDLIQTYTDGILPCTLKDTDDVLQLKKVPGCIYKFKAGANVAMTGVVVGAKSPKTGWLEVPEDNKLLSATDGNKVRVIEINVQGKITRIANEMVVS